jgi:hypothetical protein
MGITLIRFLVFILLLIISNIITGGKYRHNFDIYPLVTDNVESKSAGQ